jgi:integrase
MVMSMAGMLIKDLLFRYTAEHECRPRYVQSLERTVRKAESSGILSICQLTPENVNRMLVGLTLSDTTRHNIRREILTLWRFAYESCWTEVYPARVRKIKPCYAPPKTWTPERLEALLDTARRDETPISRRVSLKRCDVLPAWVGISYDTGLRFGDTLALTAENLANACVTVRQQKTGKVAVRRISTATQADVAALLAHSPDGSLFRWFLCRRRAFYLWRKFLDEHGFGGYPRWFRRAAATQVHKAKRGAATEFLGHSAAHLAARHYIDASQLDDQIAPPPLGVKTTLS